MRPPAVRFARLVLLLSLLLTPACWRTDSGTLVSDTPIPSLLAGGTPTPAVLTINLQPAQFPPAQLSLPPEALFARTNTVKATLATTDNSATNDTPIAFLFDLTLDLEDLRTTGQSTHTYLPSADNDSDPAFGIFLDNATIQLAPTQLTVTTTRNDTGGANITLSGTFHRVGQPATAADIPVQATFFATVMQEVPSTPKH